MLAPGFGAVTLGFQFFRNPTKRVALASKLAVKWTSVLF
jgi:hypothetical protein